MHDLFLVIINFVSDYLLANTLVPIPTLRQPRQIRSAQPKAHNERPVGPTPY
jgi:hypothetical protein